MFNVYDSFRFTIFLFSSTGNTDNTVVMCLRTKLLPVGLSVAVQAGCTPPTHFLFYFLHKKSFKMFSFKNFLLFLLGVCLTVGVCVCVKCCITPTILYVCFVCLLLCVLCYNSKVNTIEKMIFLKLTTKPEMSSKTRVGV